MSATDLGRIRGRAAPIVTSSTKHSEQINVMDNCLRRVIAASWKVCTRLAVETVRRDDSMWGAAKNIQPQSLLNHTLAVLLAHVNRVSLAPSALVRSSLDGACDVQDVCW